MKEQHASQQLDAASWRLMWDQRMKRSVHHTHFGKWTTNSIIMRHQSDVFSGKIIGKLET